MPSGVRVPMSSIDPVMEPDPMVGNAKVVGRPDFWFRVVRKMEKVLTAATPKKKTKRYVAKTAQELADEKRHTPLFEGGIEINLHTNEEKK